MKASEITKPGAYWFFDDDQYLVPGWRIIEVRRRDGRLVVLWPGAYSDGSVDDLDSDGQVVGPIEPPGPTEAANLDELQRFLRDGPNPRMDPAVGDVLHVSAEGGVRVTITAISHNLLGGEGEVAIYCDPPLWIEGRLRRHATFSMSSWRTLADTWIVERLGPR